MNDVANVPMYIPILISLAILMVPGIVIESMWWFRDRQRNLRGDPAWGAEERPVRGPLTRDEEERNAA